MELGSEIFAEWVITIVYGCLTLFFDFHLYLLGDFCALPPIKRPWLYSLCWCRLFLLSLRWYCFHIYENSRGGTGFRQGCISVLSDVPEIHLYVSKTDFLANLPHSLAGDLLVMALNCSRFTSCSFLRFPSNIPQMILNGLTRDTGSSPNLLL